MSEQGFEEELWEPSESVVDTSACGDDRSDFQLSCVRLG